MLSVHHYYQPLAPPRRATPTRRHKEVIIERGRSRMVSQVALARQKSEERRKRVVISRCIAEQPQASTPRATSPTALKAHGPSMHNTTRTQLERQSPVASSSSGPSRSGPQSASELPRHSSGSASDSSRQPRVTSEPYLTSVSGASFLFGDDEEPSTSVDNLSLQDQMQQAYAACQTICLPNPGRKHCRCRNMHRARVLYLKTQGIDVTSDDDPRIDKVHDDDFVFVPGGELVLDEESLAALNEERERREKEVQARKDRARDKVRAVDCDRSRVAMAAVQRYDEISASTSCDPQRLEFRAKRDRPLRSNTVALSRQCTDADQCTAPSKSSHTEGAENKPCPVSFQEIVQSVHGPLFPDCELQRSRSPLQDRLLDSLLEPIAWQDRESRLAINEGKVQVGPRPWNYIRKNSDSDTSCISCSMSTESTISRTNSWASTTSGTSSSTCITSPASSPSSDKLQLASIIDSRVQIIHSCRTRQRTKLTVTPFSETPLTYDEGAGREQTKADLTRQPLTRDENVASVLVSRVKQSVFGLVDFASRMQQSYLRTVQFAVPVRYNTSPLSSEKPLRLQRNHEPSKPSGYRARAADVQRFAPHPVSVASRELNFHSDLNIPLLPTQSESDSSVFPRVFAPLAFVPPSPLRPREIPAAPEWRLRPVANPFTLRLKAHANCLFEKGIPWEGRAHTGSLGCGRERLTGVAFEGLGGSRLAFEAK